MAKDLHLLSVFRPLLTLLSLLFTTFLMTIFLQDLSSLLLSAIDTFHRTLLLTDSQPIIQNDEK